MEGFSADCKKDRRNSVLIYAKLYLMNIVDQLKHMLISLISRLVLALLALVMLPIVASADINLPQPLSAADIDRYQQIFALQQDKKWKQADKIIKTLDNDVLMGRVLSQRYLHPTGWRSTYIELRDWLAKYNDHPSATRIYRLAKKRQPANYKNPKEPKKGYLNGYGRAHSDVSYVAIPMSFDNRSSPSKTRAIARDIRRKIRSGYPTGAVKILANKNKLRYLTKLEEAVLRVDIAHGYFIYGKDNEAIKQAKKALKLASGVQVPRAYWIAGIASWRSGNIEQASAYMHILADLDDVADHALASAGAYWASRADLRAGHANQSITYLNRAARYQDTFYGMLAAEALGQDIRLDFSLPEVDQNYINWLNSIPGGQRAFALLQVGETYHASRELRYLWDEHNEQDKAKLMALAADTHMAGLAFRTAGILRDDTNKNWYGGLFPVPDFDTKLPIRVSQPLLLAIMRQESGFNPRAKSWAKASGLMQLMPATAAYIARDGGYRHAKRHELLIPDINIRLGEDYILYLLESPVVDSDLIRLLAAYNAGPGNLKKWSVKVNHGGDELMLLESLPARETRFYVKNVMTNLWIYSKLTGRESSMVAALAAGDGAVIQSLAQKDCDITKLSDICPE